MQIEALRPEDWNAAMLQNAWRAPPEQRYAQAAHGVQLLEAGVLDPGGVFVARIGREIVGVQVCVPLSGSVALFWLPAAACTDALVRAGLKWSRSIGCRFAQAVVNPDEGVDIGPFLRSGFRPITRMHQLGHDLDDLPEAGALMRYETYRPSLLPVFAATLERTYEGTLDCPELNGRRTIDEILHGHRGQGRYAPEFWWLAYDGNVPIGVLIMVELPDGLTWELAYLGLIPQYRRRGLGRELVVRAMHALSELPAARLIAAVDERNVPAQRLYQSLGFFALECNEVLLHFFAEL